MATEGRINTVNRFDPAFRRMHSFVLLVFALSLMLCLLYFPYFYMFGIKKNRICCEILCFSDFFPNSMNLFRFSIVENWGLSYNTDDKTYINELRHVCLKVLLYCGVGCSGH